MPGPANNRLVKPDQDDAEEEPIERPRLVLEAGCRMFTLRRPLLREGHGRRFHLTLQSRLLPNTSRIGPGSRSNFILRRGNDFKYQKGHSTHVVVPDTCNCKSVRQSAMALWHAAYVCEGPFGIDVI